MAELGKVPKWAWWLLLKAAVICSIFISIRNCEAMKEEGDKLNSETSATVSTVSPAYDLEVPPFVISRADVIQFSPGETTKEVTLSPTDWSPWIKLPPEVDYRIDINPPLGYELIYLDGYSQKIGPNQGLSWAGIRRAIFRIKGNEKGQTAVITIANQTGQTGVPASRSSTQAIR